MNFLIQYGCDYKKGNIKKIRSATFKLNLFKTDYSNLIYLFLGWTKNKWSKSLSNISQPRIIYLEGNNSNPRQKVQRPRARTSIEFIYTDLNLRKQLVDR